MEIAQFVAEAGAVGAWSMIAVAVISKTAETPNEWRQKRFATWFVGGAVFLSWLAWATP